MGDHSYVGNKACHLPEQYGQWHESKYQGRKGNGSVQESIAACSHQQFGNGFFVLDHILQLSQRGKTA